MAQRAFITSHVQRFRETKDVLSLVRALILIVSQGRTLELIYGGYCSLFHPPSLVASCGEEVRTSILGHRDEFLHSPVLTRDQVLRAYGGEFKVCSLPADFAFAMRHSICRMGDGLIIGEYGEDSRIAYVTPEACTINDHYRAVPQVRHIHAVVRYGDAEQFLVATGDGAKVLDLWVQTAGELRFVKRLRRYLAGFTAVARVKGEYYFGSDFSGRPNFIETLQGDKYFFPVKAYKLFVSRFFVFHDRYIVSVNNELVVSGGRKTLSIFDVVEKRFILCDYLHSLLAFWAMAGSNELLYVL